MEIWKIPSADCMLIRSQPATSGTFLTSCSYVSPSSEPPRLRGGMRFLAGGPPFVRPGTAATPTHFFGGCKSGERICHRPGQEGADCQRPEEGRLHVA